MRPRWGRVRSGERPRGHRGEIMGGFHFSEESSILERMGGGRGRWQARNEELKEKFSLHSAPFPEGAHVRKSHGVAKFDVSSQEGDWIHCRVQNDIWERKPSNGGGAARRLLLAH